MDGWEVLHFPVPLSSEGVSGADDWHVMGMRATGSQTVILDKVFVPEDAIALRRPRDAYHKAWNIILTAAMPIIMSTYLGVAEAAANIARVQARKRADDPATPQDETVDSGLRKTILYHELSHGIFFIDEAYREHSERFWYQRLSVEERTLFRSFLSSAGYDPTNDRIMINEMQAFLMHTPDTRAFSAALLGVAETTLANLRRRFAKDAPPSARFSGDGAFARVAPARQ